MVMIDPMNKCIGRRCVAFQTNRSPHVTGWLCRICTSTVSVHSPPVEGWQAEPDGVVVSYLHKYGVGTFPSCGGVAGGA